MFHIISDKAAIAHVTTDLGQLDFLMANQFPTRKITTFNTNKGHRLISSASYIVQKFKVSYVDELPLVWNKKTVLVLSHLSAFNEEIPATIQQIIVVCCTFKPDFEHFTLTQNQEHLKVYQRNETN